MGYDLITFSGSARLSRHNSERDRADNAAWNSVVDELRALEKQAEQITLMFCVDKIGEDE